MNFQETKVNPEALEIYANMSSYKVAGLYYTVRDSAVTVTTTFMSALFAYLALVHFAANSLSKFQVIAVSAIYSVFTFSLLTGVYSSMITLGNIDFVLNGDSGPIAAAVTYGFPVLLIASWVISILFMYQERKKS